MTLSTLDDQPETDEGEISSDTVDKPELTEDYRETVRSIRSFMGWNHIPPFESDLSDPDKSNNPWKGKTPRRPARISVSMPPDDWLYEKLEKLVCRRIPVTGTRVCRFEEGPVR